MNGVEVIEGACVLGNPAEVTCTRYGMTHDQRSGSFPSNRVSTVEPGPSARAHGSIRIVDLDLSEYTGQLGF
jgi:hypothetical protein